MVRDIDKKLTMTSKDFAYDRISNEWERFISHFDTNRRVEVIVDDFLGESAIKEKKMFRCWLWSWIFYRGYCKI